MRLSTRCYIGSACLFIKVVDWMGCMGLFTLLFWLFWLLWFYIGWGLLSAEGSVVGDTAPLVKSGGSHG